MSFSDLIRNSKLLRRPLLAVSKLLLSPLESGPALLRRAAYDAMPTPYLVTGRNEHFVVSTDDKAIGRELFLHGEFDFFKLLTALAIIKREGLPPPLHLIDVGANIGSIVIPALARNLMLSATAIEPHPKNLRLLRANIALNGLCERVRILAQAVGAESGVTLFLHESTTNSGNHMIGHTGIPIPASRLDDLELQHDNTLLWLDIEGYEGHALRGAFDLLTSGMPVVCEYNTQYLEQSNGMELFQKALEGRRIFDLKHGIHAEATNFEILSKHYPKGSDFTDILAV